MENIFFAKGGVISANYHPFVALVTFLQIIFAHRIVGCLRNVLCTLMNLLSTGKQIIV